MIDRRHDAGDGLHQDERDEQQEPRGVHHHRGAKRNGAPLNYLCCITLHNIRRDNTLTQLIWLWLIAPDCSFQGYTNVIAILVIGVCSIPYGLRASIWSWYLSGASYMLWSEFDISCSSVQVYLDEGGQEMAPEDFHKLVKSRAHGDSGQKLLEVNNLI